jgi:DTW domain-containing protein YfiP
MRTGSYLNAQFKGEARREFAWFSLLGNLPGASVAAEHAGRRIVSAIEQGRQTCTISLAANLLIRAEAEFPETTRTIMTMMNRYVLPQSAQKSTHRGKALNPLFNTLFQAVTALGRTAARELNE